MLAASRKAFEAGAVRFSIVTSGRNCPRGPELDEVCRAIEAIRREGKVAPCASLGMLGPQEARRLASAGLVRYHHNLEASEDFFPSICSTHTYAERMETLAIAREAVLEICSGGILGMGETNDQRLRLAEALAELSPESVPINFLHPAEGTRLEALPTIGVLEALAAVAIFTLLIPEARIRVAGGRERVMGGLSSLIFLAGASGLMIGDYLTTRGRAPSLDLAELDSLALKRVTTPWVD
jgi:biotin synthase